MSALVLESSTLESKRTLSLEASGTVSSPMYMLATASNSYLSCSDASSRMASFLTGGSLES
jgi:hypothetical protein